MEGADVYIGFSDTKKLTEAMIKSFAYNPIIMTMDACDNTDRVKNASGEAIIFTGAKNQSSLIFPYMTRAVLEVEAKEINLEMKVAAAKELDQVSINKGYLLSLDAPNHSYENMNSIT